MTAALAVGNRPLSGIDGLRYGLLGFPVAFAALPLYVQLPALYAAQVGLPVAAVGGVLLAARLADGCLDPLIGRRLDALTARSPAASWSIAALASALLAAGTAALFFPPVTRLGAGLAWLAACLLPTSIAYSALSIAHQAWGTRLGGDADQRLRVAAWREGAGLAGVIVAAVLPSLAGLAATWLVLAAGLGLALALLAWAPLPPAAFEIPARLVNNTAESQALATRSTAPWRNPAFRSLLRTHLLNATASAVPAALVLFYVRDALKAPGWEPAFLSAYFSCAFAATPLWLRAAKVWGLARAWRAAMLVAVLAFAVVPFIPAGHPLPFLAVCVATGFALGADLAIPGALMTACVQRLAADRAGAYAGWWTLVSKLGLALGAGIALPLLGLAGYAPGARAPGAVHALVLTYTALPYALKLSAMTSLTLTRHQWEDPR
jgi:Na+/melibiose symporter-like transporter